MKSYKIQCFTIKFLMLICLLQKNALSTEATSVANETETKNGFTVQFEPGEMVQLIVPLTSLTKNTDEAASLRSQYYQQAIPLASKYGFKQHGQLNITQTIVGDFQPSALIIASWPSLTLFEEFTKLPEWPQYKALRVKAWDELKLFNAQIEQAVTLSFREDKFYTIVVAWTNADKPSDYLAYLSGIESALERVGGRFMLQLKQPELESHDPNEQAPNYITFAEWDSKDGFEKLTQQKDYQRYIALRDSGLAKIEFHRLVPHSLR